MTKTGNTKTLTQNAGEIPSAIIDKGGRIIAFNQEFKKLLPKSNTQVNFFELFDEERLLTLQRMFIDVRKFDISSRDSIQLDTESGSTGFNVVISPMRSENNTYFVINFHSLLQGGNSSETQKFWIATSELEKVVEDKVLLSIINKIKLTFPFTFIEKAKIQKIINEYDGYFWIKDTTNKYLLVNNKYASSLGFKVSQIENKHEEEFLPKYLTNLYKMVGSYIFDSTNSVILDSITSPIASGSDRGISVIQFPLCDIDNNVVAIIGFSHIREQNAKELFKTDCNILLNEIPVPLIMIDEEFKVSGSSNETLRFLKINSKTDLIGQEISKILEKGIIPFIEEFVKDESRRNEYSFNYQFVDNIQLNAEVSLKKIFSERGYYYGTQLSFRELVEHKSEDGAKSKMYDAIIQHAPEAMFIYDIENLKFLEVNEEALKLYGYKRAEFLNMDLTDLYAPEDIQTIIESGESKSLPGSYSGPWRHKKNDGSSVMVELNRTSIDFNGKKAHLNIVRNVSDQAEMKKKLQLFETVYEHTGDSIIITDKDGFITEINSLVSKKLGYSKQDLQTRPFITLLTDDDRAKINKNVFHSGLLKTTTFEISLKKPAGNYYNATLIATPIKDYNGDIESFCLLIKIIEEPAKSSDVSHAQVDSLQSIDPPFLSNVFHEILTPINVILGFTQEIGESLDLPTDEQKEAMEIIGENQKLLLQIMDNAVEYSTLEQKVIKFKPELFNFVDVLDELKENTRKTAEDKKVDIVFESISSSLALETDNEKFTSLLRLILKFVIQITKENSVYLSAARFNDDYLAVKFKDTPSQISPYLLKALNEVLSIDENMSRRNYGFSRFSVKLAKKLIEILSAKKEIISKDGVQQEFALVFPLKFVLADKSTMELESAQEISKRGDAKAKQKSAVKAQDDKNIPEKIVTGESKNLNLSLLSCLYLEDQVDSQMLFKVQLKELKSIEFAPSFESALPLLKMKKFDFIVMDINLQGEYNGLDALRIIQKMPGFKDIPIIASTAYVQPGARDNFIAAGFSDFVSKPLLREKLLDVLKNFF